MKYSVLICFMASFASTATACDLMGIKGHISDDGQSITSRQPIALKEQARLYGGYAGAADYVEKNRQSVMNNDKFSPDVKRQVDRDLRANVAQLQCWAAVCSRDSTNSSCAL